MKLSDLNLKTLDIVYKDSTHTYRRGIDQKLFAGVSSICGIMDKPYLKQWAANMCGDYVRTNWTPGVAYTQEQIDLIVADGKKAHARKSDKAKEAGTDGHSILEIYIGKRIANESFTLDASLVDKVFMAAFDDFLKWEADNHVEWIASELLVGHMVDEIAGRFDALALVNGKLTIVDFKFADSIYAEYFLQTAGYVYCLNWMLPEPTNIERLLLRFPKTETRKLWNGKYYEEVKNVFTPVPVPTDLVFDTETFRQLRQAYKWKNQKLLKEW